MKTLILFSVLLLAASRMQAADFTGPNKANSSVVPTNMMVAAAAPSKVYDITAYNTSSSDLWLHFYDSATNQLDNARPLAVVQIPANDVRSFVWTSGRPCRRGICVAASTTDVTLTNAGTVLQIDVTYLDRMF